MKRILIAFLFFFGLTQVNAQVTFKPGLRAGLNLSKITQSDASTRTDFYIAGFGELKLTKYYTLQPEISYSKQGGNDVLVEIFNNQTGSYDFSKEDISVDYISLAIVNKFTFNNRKYFIYTRSTCLITINNFFNFTYINLISNVC